MAKKFLILKTGTTIPPLLAQKQDFEHWFISASAGIANNYSVCNLYLGEVPPELDKVLGIIITGSAAYVTDAEAWNFVAADYLRLARASAVPILGVCYGHQLVAWTFGGVVEFHARGREIGTVEISCAENARQDVLFSGLPVTFKAQVSHQQTVTVLPAGAVHLAGNNFEPNQAYRLDKNIWCVQFHPEFTADIVRAYIQHRAVAIAAEGLNVDELLAAVVESGNAAELLRRFTRYCLEPGSGAAS